MLERKQQKKGTPHHFDFQTTFSQIRKLKLPRFAHKEVGATIV